MCTDLINLSNSYLPFELIFKLYRKNKIRRNKILKIYKIMQSILNCTLELTHIHTYIHTFIHTYMHTYIHSYVHAYIYINTYTRPLEQAHSGNAYAGRCSGYRAGPASGRRPPGAAAGGTDRAGVSCHYLKSRLRFSSSWRRAATRKAMLPEARR